MNNKGFCVGIPGQQPHAVSDPNDLIFGRCQNCEEKLTSTAGWGSAQPNVNKNQGKGEPIIINHLKHVPKDTYRRKDLK